MSKDGEFEIFLVAAPGLEAVLRDEALAKGFKGAKTVAGGVAFDGGWPDVWRANLVLRGAGRVLARIGAFRALHLAQLDKRSRRFPWGQFLKPGVAVRVTATCSQSRIYHSGAASERIERAIREEFGSPVADDAPINIRARIDDDLCTFSIDTSGEALYKRGHKEAVSKAPMRETMAALLLQKCGYSGREPVLDPMCGSGTFVLEAADIATGLYPGRSRSFAFEHLATFDPAVWRHLKQQQQRLTPTFKICGSDQDAGAVRMSLANAERAGTADICEFRQCEVAEVVAPDGPPGLVIVNPPYGARIGENAGLHSLYRTLGDRLKSQFAGWRVGVVTSDAELAKATGLPFGKPFGPISHGGLRVTLFQTQPLPKR